MVKITNFTASQNKGNSGVWEYSLQMKLIAPSYVVSEKRKHRMSLGIMSLVAKNFIKKSVNSTKKTPKTS